MKIRCTFFPQAWVRDTAMQVDPQGPDTWTMTLLEMEETTGVSDPEELDDHPYQRDDLRLSKNAPDWVKNWSGPFEIEWELLQPGEPDVAATTT